MGRRGRHAGRRTLLRLTAPLCIAGGIAKQILARRGIFVGAHLSEVAGIPDSSFPLHPTPELLSAVAAKDFPVLDEEAGARMQQAILEARQEGDSVGGIVECAAIGLPAGLGEPMFGGVENWRPPCSASPPSRAWSSARASPPPGSGARRTTTPLP